MLFTWKAFNRKLLAATRAKDVLSLLAQGAWHKRRGRIKPCPDDRIPPVDDLAKWLPDCLRQAWIDTWKRCAPLLQDGEIESVGLVPYLIQPAYLAVVKQAGVSYRRHRRTLPLASGRGQASGGRREGGK